MRDEKETSCHCRATRFDTDEINSDTHLRNLLIKTITALNRILLIVFVVIAHFVVVIAIRDLILLLDSLGFSKSVAKLDGATIALSIVRPTCFKFEHFLLFTSVV